MSSKTTRLLRAVGTLPLAAAPWLAAQAAPIAPPSGDQDATWTFHHDYVLGTSLQITVRAADSTRASAAEAAALATFDRQAAILSAWQSESEFSRWARTRFVPVPVSAELADTLSAFDTWRERTGGALDPSVEAATRLWTNATAQGRKPTDVEIQQTIEAIAQPHWSVDRSRLTATRLSDVPLALASFAKSRIASQAADAALSAGATGIMLNVGGDVVVRGALTQLVAITNAQAAAENDAPLDYVAVSNAAIATSGGYLRGFSLVSSKRTQTPAFSHLIDPRTAQPVNHILSSTVLARDAETAGALATAFSVMPPEASRRLAAQTPGVEYLIVTADGPTITSPGWSAYRLPGRKTATLRPASYAVPAKPSSSLWDPNYELSIELTIPQINEGRARRPYVAVWIEDADHTPVRTLSLWYQKPRWLPELKEWYREDQARSQSDSTDLAHTISSATRPPGQYTIKWDGKDNQGKLLKAGSYTVVVEAAREHGGYQVDRQTVSFTGKPEQATMAAGQEIGTVLLDYRKR